MSENEIKKSRRDGKKKVSKEQMEQSTAKLSKIADRGHSSLQQLLEVARAMNEGEFYKEVKIELGGELGKLADYILSTRESLQELEPGLKEGWSKIPQASFQLSSVTDATEEAANKIMALAEKFFEDQQKKRAILDDLSDMWDDLPGNLKVRYQRNIENWRTILDQHDEELLEMMTALSFQDLTGQKIKKVTKLVQDVEKRIFEIMAAFQIIKADESVAEREKQLEKFKKQEKLRTTGGIGQGMVNDILEDIDED